jgi:hypothetical protein
MLGYPPPYQLDNFIEDIASIHAKYIIWQMFFCNIRRAVQNNPAPWNAEAGAA